MAVMHVHVTAGPLAELLALQADLELAELLRYAGAPEEAVTRAVEQQRAERSLSLPGPHSPETRTSSR